MKRYEALRELSSLVTAEDLAVVSIGMTSNEWYALMPGEGTVFLGLMGGVVPFAFGLGVALPHRRVVAIDTDGSFLSNPGALCTVVNEAPANLTILVIDNESYEGVGGHPTHTSRRIDLERIAAGTGIEVTGTARDPQSVARLSKAMLEDGKPGFLCVKVGPGAFHDFPPGKVKLSDGREDKFRFIRHVERQEGVSIKPPYVRS
jgi:thiamine pyrophosphate-dependent acetolactate synthase large subunit-like protein